MIELNWEDAFIISNRKFFFFFLSLYDIMLRVISKCKVSEIP